MKRDSFASSHPIIQPVNNPDQITEIFDKISYNKVRPLQQKMSLVCLNKKKLSIVVFVL